MARPAGPPPVSTDRAAFAISQIYYYVAVVVGVAFLVGGAIAALIAVRQLVLPGDTDTTRQSVRNLLDALAYAVPGAVLFAWHIREAGRRERRSLPGVFWGAALYYHLVALFAVFTVLGGAIALLGSTVDLVLPSCFEGLSVGIDPPPFPCYPPHDDAARSIANAVIVLLVGGAVFAWHLRRGRRLAPPERDAGRPDVPMMEG